VHRTKINVTVQALCYPPTRQTADIAWGGIRSWEWWVFSSGMWCVHDRGGGSNLGKGSNSESSNRNLAARQQGQEISEWKIRESDMPAS